MFSCSGGSQAGDKIVLPLDDNERLLGLQMALKCADIGHVTAALPTHIRWVAAHELYVTHIHAHGTPTRTHTQIHTHTHTHTHTYSWVSQLEEEFFLQGDVERAAGTTISPLFDRCKQGITKSQASELRDITHKQHVHCVTCRFLFTLYPSQAMESV